MQLAKVSQTMAAAAIRLIEGKVKRQGLCACVDLVLVFVCTLHCIGLECIAVLVSNAAHFNPMTKETNDCSSICQNQNHWAMRRLLDHTNG
jgi:hypothetical protein